MMLKVLFAALTIMCVNTELICDPKYDCELPSNPIAVPDPVNCRNFFACNEGVPEEISFTCGENSHFNGNLIDPKCIDGDCKSPVCPGHVIPICKTSCDELLPAQTGWIAFPGDCTSAYYCSPESGKSVFHCPDGHYFNGIDCSAENESDACCSVCGVPRCTEELEKDYKKLPDKSNCEKFYICLNGIPLSQTCPSGESFDLLSYECMSAETAFCHPYCSDADDNTDIISVPPESIRDIETTELETTDISETPETTDTDTPETTDIYSAESPEIICLDMTQFACTYEGQFPICNTCYQYYITCISESGGFIATESLCEGGLFFNPMPDYFICMEYEDCETG